MNKLLDLIEKNDKLPMHMPGHKRNVNLSENCAKLAVSFDMTEIHGFDNLANPEGILAEYMEKAAKLWKSHKSFFLVNGSTCGILAGIKSLANEGDTVLVGRNAHKSVYHAIELLGLKTVFLKGEIYNSSGMCAPVCENDVLSALEDNHKIKLLILTNPNYEGFVCDLAKIRKVCDLHNIKMLVDEAHGSHFGFNQYFPKSAVEIEADIVVQSLHKTFIGLTQTAMLHINKTVDEAEVLRNINIFQTSSPSYILLSSICECVEFLENGDYHFRSWKSNLENFYAKSKHFKHIYVIDTDNNKKDKSKILISTANANISGVELTEILRTDYKIELEMAYGDCALAMSGFGDTENSLETLFNALNDIDNKLQNKPNYKKSFSLNLETSKPQMSIKEAMKLPKTELKSGEISTRFMYLYPPGIPLVVPGEIVKKDVLDIAEKLKSYGSDIIIQ